MPPVKSAAFHEGEERRVFRAPVTILLLGVLAGPVHVSGQVESGPAVVTLVARVQESFALSHGALPVTGPEADEVALNPAYVQVVLGWWLRHGRSFQVGYDLAEDTGDRPLTLASGMVLPSRIQAAPLVQSFLPSHPTPPGTVSAWGNAETDPSGVAGVVLYIPPSGQAQSHTLRLRAIIL